VSSDVKATIESINELSQILLAQFDIQRESTEGNVAQQTSTELSADSATTNQYSDEKLLHLVASRDALIRQLFERYNQAQLSAELVLINEMVSLDQQLTSKSLQNKQALSAQVLKLRKNKKITNLYQKANQNLSRKY